MPAATRRPPGHPRAAMSVAGAREAGAVSPATPTPPGQTTPLGPLRAALPLSSPGPAAPTPPTEVRLRGYEVRPQARTAREPRTVGTLGRMPSATCGYSGDSRDTRARRIPTPATF